MMNSLATKYLKKEINKKFIVNFCYDLKANYNDLAYMKLMLFPL